MNPNITLLHHTPLEVCSHAIRTCWSSFDKGDCGGEKDRELINRVGNVYKHASVLESLVYSFFIQGISRACLQELARHRIASYSVKSSRYTLAELKRADISTLEKASKFIKLTSNDKVNQASHKALQNLKELLLDSSTTNDVAKYAMPECYLTELTWTVNARSLQNFLTLRTSKHALWEIQELALCIYEALPQEHKYLFEKCVGSGKGDGDV